MPEKYDVIVIGTGPGGEGAAMKASKEGKRVLVVDKSSEVGGSCTHTGTIPSKALRSAVQRMMSFTNNPLFHELSTSQRLSYPELLKSAESVITKQVRMRRSFYERNDIKLVEGHARFIEPKSIEVIGRNLAHEWFEADHFVIATGSRPFRPDDVDFTHPRILDADTILSLKDTPRSITVYGAGVIGCEYASVFRSLQVKLNLVNTREKLLEFLDDEIIDALGYHLREQGALIRHNEVYEKIEGLPDGVIVHLKSGKRLKTDVMLWANGRTGNSDNLGLDAVDIEPNPRGHIPVNEYYQTSQPHIYAVGDVIGRPGLASASYDQGRIAAEHLIHGTSNHLVDLIPTGIYTSPEISSVGATERELTDKKIPYELGHAFFRNLARAQIAGQTVGMLKLLFHRETLQILGVHCFGARASEIVHIGQAIMSQPGEQNTLMYFANTTFNYPTMAEAYRVAALNGLNRVF